MNIAATSTTKEIYQAGCGLLEQKWDSFHHVRLIGISLSGFNEQCAALQLTLID